MSFPPVDLVALAAVIFPVSALAAAAIAVQWRKVRIAEQDAALKKEMLDRGFTADDIVRGVEAGRSVRESDAGQRGRG